MQAIRIKGFNFVARWNVGDMRQSSRHFRQSRTLPGKLLKGNRHIMNTEKIKPLIKKLLQHYNSKEQDIEKQKTFEKGINDLLDSISLFPQELFYMSLGMIVWGFLEGLPELQKGWNKDLHGDTIAKNWLDAFTAPVISQVKNLAPILGKTQEDIEENISKLQEDISKMIPKVGTVIEGMKVRGTREYGYKVHKDTHGNDIMIPDKEEQQIIERITTLRINGDTFQGIADKLEKLGVKTATENTKWHIDTIRRILKRRGVKRGVKHDKTNLLEKSN